MDDIQDHLADLYSLYRTHSSTISSMTYYLQQTRLYLTTYLGPLVTSKPDLTTLFLLLVILFLSLKLLNMLVRTVLWWVKLAFRLAFWGGLLLLVGWVYTRGVEGVVQDVSGLGRTWGAEYQYWEARAAHAQRVLTGDRGGTGRTAYARTNARRARAW